MATRTARIKAHTRTSKNGKTHKVRAHGRTVSMAELWASFRNNATVKKITWSSAGTAGFIGVAYVLSTAMNVMAAAIWAILLGCMAVVAMLLMTKQQRRAKRRKFRAAAALSVERRLKLWTHHRMVQFKKPAVKKAPASKPRPSRKSPSSAEGVTHKTGRPSTYQRSVLPNASLRENAKA